MTEGAREAGAEGAVGRLGTVVLVFKRLLLPEEDQAIEAESVHVPGEQGAVGSRPRKFVADHVQNVFVFVVVYFLMPFFFKLPNVPMAWPMLSLGHWE